MSNQHNSDSRTRMPKDLDDIWMTCIDMKRDMAVLKEQLRTLNMLVKIMLIAMLGFGATALVALLR